MDKRRWKSAVSADLNDARKRVRSPSADRRRGWARGELPRTAFPRAPPPEARRAEPPQAAKRARQNPPQADWPPRRTPPIFTRAALPAGHRPTWPPSPDLEESRARRRRASPAAAGRASSTRSREQRRGRAAPAKAAHRRASGGAVAASGAAIPERRPRAARIQRSGAQRRA